MEKRIHLFITRKNGALWLMVLCLLASAVIRTGVFLTVENAGLWRYVLLPVTATLLFALIAVISGEEMLYKTAIPVWLLGICYCWQFYGLLRDTPVLLLLVCSCVAFFCTAYTSLISGRIHWPWLMVLLELAALGAVIYTHRWLWRLRLPMRTVLYVLPEYLFLLGLLMLQLGVRVHGDGKYHPTWGDRSDGRRVRTLPPMAQIEPYIMVNRNGACNLFSEAVEITQVERYIRRKRREGMTGLGLSHVIVAAYVRTVAKYPALNRFIAGQKVYSRGEDVAVCMVVKKDLTLSSPDTVIKVHLDPRDTLGDVFRKFSEKVEEAKNTPLDSGMDNTAAILTLIPGLLLKFTVWLLRVLDYFGKLPGFLLEISPFHASIFFTSMGSLGIRPVYHHLYDFGTIPAFCAFGKKRRVEEIIDGEIVEKKYIDLTFNLEDRTCDGFYYATAVKYYLRLLRHPELLDVPPEKAEADIP